MTSPDAIVRTMSTAGRAVVFSGLAVATGLALLLFVPVPFIRSMGVAGLLVPLVSIAGALTLQPVLLSLVGRRLSPRAARRGEARGRRCRGGSCAGRSGCSSAALPCCSRSRRRRSRSGSLGSFEGIPHAPESSQGLDLLRDGVGSGAVTPTHVVIDGGARSRPAIERLANGLARDPEVHIVARGRRPPYVDDHRRFSRVIVVGRHEYGDETQGPRPPAARPTGAGGRLPDGDDCRLRRRAVPGRRLPLLDLRRVPVARLAVLSVTFVVCSSPSGRSCSR